jgi:hypothetical protein
MMFFANASFIADSLKLDSDSAASARVPLPTFRHITLPFTVAETDRQNHFGPQAPQTHQSQRHCSEPAPLLKRSVYVQLANFKNLCYRGRDCNTKRGILR